MNILDNQLAMYTVVVVMVLVLAAIFWYTGRKETARKIVLSVVIEAERRFGSGTGKVKYATVVGMVYPLLPVIVRLFVTEDQLDIWIEEGVEELKDILSEPDPNTNSTKSAELVSELKEKAGGTSETTTKADTAEGGGQSG